MQKCFFVKYENEKVSFGNLSAKMRLSVSVFFESRPASAQKLV